MSTIQGGARVRRRIIFSVSTILLVFAMIISPLTVMTDSAAAVYGDDAVRWHPGALGEISAGHGSSCAIAGGAAYCRGSNELGMLGNGASADPNNYFYSYTPVAVDTSGVLAGKTLNHISNGWSHVCASDVTGGVYCWGDNAHGGLGNGTTTSSTVPVAVDTSGVLAGKTIKDLRVGDLTSCALASDDQVYCWGLGESGQLGNGTTTSSTVPVAVDTTGVLAGKAVKKLAVSGYHACVVASDDQVYCWGANEVGQLGDGTTTHRSVPTAIVTSGELADKVSVDVVAGYYFTCTLTSEGFVYCWGWNDLGALGNGTQSGSQVPQPIDVSGGLAGKTVQSIDAGYRSACAITTDARVYCWGNLVNVSSIVYTPTLLDVSGAIQGKQIASLSLGSNHGCVTTTDGYMACWGAGLLENGNETLTPTFILSKLPSAVVDGVTFAEEDGRKVMTIEGDGFGNYGNSFVKSLVKVNGVSLGFCAEGTGATAQELIDMFSGQGTDLTGLVTDTPPCYFLIKGGQIAYTFTQAVVWLPNTFDTNAEGTVSVNDSASYTFNPTDNGEVPTEAEVHVNGTKPLDQHPTIKPLPTFRGVATPGATVVVTVHSDPVTCTTIADSNGNWSCTLSVELPAGEHTVYVQVTNPDNSVENLGPYSVTVAGATITNTTPKVPNTGFIETIKQHKEVQVIKQRDGVIVSTGVGVLVSALGAGVLFGAIQMKRRRSV